MSSGSARNDKTALTLSLSHRNGRGNFQSYLALARFAGEGRVRVLRVFHEHTPAQLGLDSSTPCWNDEQRQL